jgi:hypothetical protein
MKPRSLRHVLAFVGGTAIGLAWVHWGLNRTLVVAFVALVLVDIALWIWQKREEERAPRIED